MSIPIFNDINHIINGLEQSPIILNNLLSQIPPKLIMEQRIKSKWSIHEHACHVATGDQSGFIDRFRQFLNESQPRITPLSGESFPADHLLKMDLNEALAKFFEKRKELISLVKSADASIWSKKAEHPEYYDYTPYIMLRHRLMHDHYHLYRIEELWLTTEEYLPRCQN